jgi:hypothetical protein
MSNETPFKKRDETSLSTSLMFSFFFFFFDPDLTRDIKKKILKKKKGEGRGSFSYSLLSFFFSRHESVVCKRVSPVKPSSNGISKHNHHDE